MNSREPDRQPGDRRRAEGRRAGQEGRDASCSRSTAPAATRAPTSSASRRGTGRPRSATSTSRRASRVARRRPAAQPLVGGRRRQAPHARSRSSRTAIEFLDTRSPRGVALRGGCVVGSRGRWPAETTSSRSRTSCSTSSRFRSTAVPGLQVVGADEVSKLACGVSSSRELFERAGAAGAQLVLVHHGLFWRNEPLLVDRRLKGRLEALFAANLTLVAYHLALDAHPELGNNALLAERLGADARGRVRRHRRGGALRRAGRRSASSRSGSRRRRAATPLVFAEGPGAHRARSRSSPAAAERG